jgi:membrane protein DedA with SNARE-associated domain
VGLTEQRLRIGRYLFQRHGGKVVFFGRFVAILRTFAAVLAGANGMHWRSFVIFNIAGGIAWSSLYGCGAYMLGDTVRRLTGLLAVVFGVIAAIVIGTALIFARRNEHRLAQEVERATSMHAAEPT